MTRIWTLAALLLLATSTTVEARCLSTCQDDYKRRVEADAESRRVAAEQRARERIDLPRNTSPQVGGSYKRSTMQDEVDALTRRIQTLEDDR